MAPMDEIVLEKWTNLLAFRPHIKTQSILFHRNIRTDSIAILNYIIEFEHRTQNADNLRSFYLCEFGINKTKIQFEFTNSGPFFNVSKTITKFCTRPLESRLRFPLPFDVVFGKAFSCARLICPVYGKISRMRNNRRYAFSQRTLGKYFYRLYYWYARTHTHEP